MSGSGSIRHAYPCNLDLLQEMRSLLSAAIDSDSEVDISVEDREKLLLAYNEALANAIEHGNDNNPERQIEIDISISRDRLVITISHAGRSFTPDPSAIKLPDCNELPEGGFGLYITHQVFEEVVYGIDRLGRNFVRLVRKLSANAM